MDKKWLWLLGILGIGYLVSRGNQAKASDEYQKAITSTAVSPVSLPPATGLPMLSMPTPADMNDLGKNYL